MSAIKIKIAVDELDNVLQSYDQIKIYRSTTGYGGTYTELTAVGTRIDLIQGQDRYEYDDLAGDPTYYYRLAFFDSTGVTAESDQSEPRLGEDQSAVGVLSVEDLKNVFLFGLDLTDDAGNAFPDVMFEWGIRSAIATLERRMDIRIKPTSFTQLYDYYRRDYETWVAIRLRECPVVSVSSVKVQWPAGATAITFPDDWIQLRADAGQVNIVPASGSYSQALLTGGIFPTLMARGFVPNILEVTYTAGFAAGQVPQDILDVIGKMASFAPLNVAGDLIVGAGIASKTISMDGLSQSINTTSSATNAGYGARLGQYAKEIKQVLPDLIRYYKGIRMVAL